MFQSPAKKNRLETGVLFLHTYICRREKNIFINPTPLPLFGFCCVALLYNIILLSRKSVAPCIYPSALLFRSLHTLLLHSIAGNSQINLLKSISLKLFPSSSFSKMFKSKFNCFVFQQQSKFEVAWNFY